MSNQNEEPLPLTSSGALVVRPTPYTGEANARGVFATVPIARGTLLDVCHCLVFPKEEHDAYAMKTVLQHYTFHAGGGTYFLALGMGSLFNHNDPPNVDYRIQRPQERIAFVACRDIAAGEELFIFYGANVWFHDTRKEETTATVSAKGVSNTSPLAEETENSALPFLDEEE